MNWLPSQMKFTNMGIGFGISLWRALLAVLTECKESSDALHRMLHIILIMGNFINGVSPVIKH